MVHAIAIPLSTFEVIREGRLLEECFEYSLPPGSTHEELCECQILWDAGNCVLWELRKQLSGDMPSAGHGHRGRHTKLLFAAGGFVMPV